MLDEHRHAALISRRRLELGLDRLHRQAWKSIELFIRAADVNVVAFARASHRMLQVFDVVGPRIPSWTDLLRYLPPFETHRIEAARMGQR